MPNGDGDGIKDSGAESLNPNETVFGHESNESHEINNVQNNTDTVDKGLATVNGDDEVKNSNNMDYKLDKPWLAFYLVPFDTLRATIRPEDIQKFIYLMRPIYSSKLKKCSIERQKSLISGSI